jgi:hypothetical protein
MWLDTMSRMPVSSPPISSPPNGRANDNALPAFALGLVFVPFNLYGIARSLRSSLGPGLEEDSSPPTNPGVRGHGHSTRSPQLVMGLVSLGVGLWIDGGPRRPGIGWVHGVSMSESRIAQSAG